MHFLKRVFGIGNEESDQQLAKEIEQIKKGNIKRVYPILKPGNWIGVKAGALKQTLIGTQENPELVVAFGYNAPTNFVFLMHKDLELHDPGLLLKDAYANLEGYRQNFEISEALGKEILFASGRDFSSEKILCKSHMLKAQELLETDELLVSIPRRRCMMVTSREVSKERLNTFVTLHHNAWEDDSYGNAPILNALLVVKNRKISELIKLD